MGSTTIAGTVWGVLVATGLLPAQALRWQLPAMGAAEYRRQWSARSAVAETAAAARELEPAGPVPARYLPRLAPAPFLCEGELDPERTRIADPPRDLRDVVRAVALDLGVRGSGHWRFHRVPPFGDLVVSGTVSSPGDQGVQELRLSIEREEPTPLPGDGKDLRERTRPFCDTKARGTLAVTRSVDAALGLVRDFRAELCLQVDEGKGRQRKIVLQDQWTLVAVRENQDADFRRRVAAAVRAGAAWIRAALDGLDASYLQDKEQNRSFGSGRLALAVLTLLHAEVPASDPVAAAGLAALGRRKLVDSYSLGVALMTLAARYAPAREAELVRAGQVAGRAPRELAAADQKRAERWVAQLLRNVDKRVDPAEVLRFNYTAGPRCDTSIQQYGLLGMDAAALCRVAVPATAFAAAGRHLLAVQGPANGRSVGLALALHREVAAAAGGPPPRPKVVRTAARGFGYRDADDPAYGGLTAAGITGLVLARAGMLAGGGKPAEDPDRFDAAIREGFSWLAAEFTVRSNPGFVGRAHSHWYYWLYGLERACELAGIAWLNDRDWYYEGALQLLAQQQPNGSFRAADGDDLLLDATCFAVLFLKKATLPVATGR